MCYLFHISSAQRGLFPEEFAIHENVLSPNTQRYWGRDSIEDYLSRRMFMISQAALATDVPGPKTAATPAL